MGGALPSLPERFSLAFAVHPDGISASIIAAWRNEDGKAVPGLLEHRRGIEWVAAALVKISRKYTVPITYDSGSQQAALVVELLNRAKPRPKLDPRLFADVKKSASLVVDEVERGNVEHYRQPELDQAVQVTVRRGTKLSTAWALGRSEPNDDITPPLRRGRSRSSHTTSRSRNRHRGRRGWSHEPVRGDHARVHRRQVS